MPPEQRAKVEASIRAQAGQGKPHTSRSCVTREDLDRGQLGHSDQPNCKRKVITQNAGHLEMEEVCTGPEPSNPTSSSTHIERALHRQHRHDTGRQQSAH